MKTIIFLSLLPSALYGQAGYHATVQSAASLTIQQAAVGGKLAQMDTLWVQCAAKETIILSRNGTAATKTSVPFQHLPMSGDTKLTAWADSNVGLGTQLKSLEVPARQDRSFSLKEYKITTEGRGINFTARTASGQKCKITIAVTQ